MPSDLVDDRDPAATPAPGRRVAMFINCLERGGGQQQFLRIARALHRRGDDVRIYMAQDVDDFAHEHDGIPVELLSASPGPATILNAVRTVRRWRPDVVLSFLYQATLVARFAGALNRTPVIVSSMRNERLETPMRTRLYRLTSRVDHATVTNSARAAEVLQAEGTVPRGRLIVIPNGLDLSLFESPAPSGVRAELGLADDTFLFLGIGRLVPQKDWPMLLDAVARYDGPPAHWAVVGEGAGLDDLTARIASGGLSDRVSLLGLRDDVPGLLAAADALVLSSTYEGLPNVVLEAMASALPVVATRVGGCPELVSPETGLLVESGDPAGLADAMAELAGRSAGERAAMGAAARAHVHRHYSLESAERAWTALLDDLVARRRRRGGR